MFPHVVAAGEFAVRGGIVDLFPMGSEIPYRIDLFDDEIDSIKTFDTETQRTISPVSEIRLLPAHGSHRQRAQRFAAAAFVGKSMAIRTMPLCTKPSQRPLRRGRGILSAAVFENELETLFDYIGEDALFVSLGDVHAEANRFERRRKSRYRHGTGAMKHIRPLLPQHLCLSSDVLQAI